jgi:hypothetical protein
MIFKLIGALVFSICVIILTFTNLTPLQFLLLLGILLGEGIEQWSDFFANRRKSKK